MKPTVTVENKARQGFDVPIARPTALETIYVVQLLYDPKALIDVLSCTAGNLARFIFKINGQTADCWQTADHFLCNITNIANNVVISNEVINRFS